MTLANLTRYRGTDSRYDTEVYFINTYPHNDVQHFVRDVLIISMMVEGLR